MNKVMRVAMWSGPRNISTAMMRAWENRPDTEVVDEPFYACYLKATHLEHPLLNQVLESQSSDWKTVVAQLSEERFKPETKIQYQKQMSHHMVEGFDAQWFSSLNNIFLIRHPEKVLASYAKKRQDVTANDLGYETLYRLYDQVSSAADGALIIDSDDVLNHPEKILTAVCKHLDIPFYSQMLCWPVGSRDTDGVWAKHWYNNVKKSTGFQIQKDREIRLSSEQQKIVNQCLPFFQRLYERRLSLE